MAWTAEYARNRHASRQAARRREAATLLQIAEATCRYGASRLANWIGPEEARQTALFIAGELESVAAGLRRLTRLTGPERQALALELASRGELTTRQIARQLGVSDRAARTYLSGRACP